MSRTKAIAYTIGAALSAAILAVVGWGQVRNVHLTRPGSWPGPVPICATPDVDARQLEQVVGELRAHGFRPRLDRGECTPGLGRVTIRVDPSLDTTGQGYGGTVSDGVYVEEDEHTVWGVTSTLFGPADASAPHGRWVLQADVRLHPGQGVSALRHELACHVMGFDDLDNAPSGHVCKHSKPGDDWRGVDGP